MRVLFGLCCLAFLSPAADAQPAARAEIAAPRYYVVIGDVTEPDGAHSAIGAELRRLFAERLKQRPDVTLDTPSWLPQNADAQKLALYRHAMRAYNASVNIEALDTEVLPSLANPSRGTITVTARVRIYGHTLPGRALKIGGEGEAESSMPIAIVDIEAVRPRLVREALAGALHEAMLSTVEKIELVGARERAER